MIIIKNVCSNCGKEVPGMCDGEVYKYSFPTTTQDKILDGNGVWVSPWIEHNFKLLTWRTCQGENLERRAKRVKGRLVFNPYDAVLVYLEKEEGP